MKIPKVLDTIEENKGKYAMRAALLEDTMGYYPNGLWSTYYYENGKCIAHGTRDFESGRPSLEAWIEFKESLEEHADEIMNDNEDDGDDI